MGELEDFIRQELRRGRHTGDIIADLVDEGHIREDVSSQVMGVQADYRLRKLISIGVLSLFVIVVIVLLVGLLPLSSSPDTGFSEPVIDGGVDESVSGGFVSNTSEFYVSLVDEGVFPSEFELQFLDQGVFVFRNLLSESVTVVFDGVRYVVSAGERSNVTFFADRIGSVDIDFFVGGRSLGSAVLVVTPRLSVDASFSGVYVRVPGDSVSRELFVGDAVGLMVESVDGTEYVFSSSLGSVVALERPFEFVLFEFSSPGEFVFSSPGVEQEIRFVVTNK